MVARVENAENGEIEAGDSDESKVEAIPAQQTDGRQDPYQEATSMD